MRKRSKIKLAIVVDKLDSFGGAEQVVSSLIDEFPGAVLYTSYSDKKFLKENFPGVKVVNSIINYLPFFKALRNEYLLLQPLAYKLFSFKKYDIVISVSTSFAKFIRSSKTVPHIHYCLTPPKFFWLEEGRTIKDMERASFKFYSFFRGTILEKIWQMWDRNAARKATKVVSISEVVSERVKRIYGIDSEVVYPPVKVKEIDFHKDLKKRENWFLYHGRIERYKGVELAIRACVENKVPLKVSGIGSDFDNMKELVQELNAKGVVQMLGYTTDKIKTDLLKRCKGLISPIIDEDFGIVPVEANAAGVPVIAHDSGGVRETVSEKNPKTGMFFKKWDVESLSRALKRFRVEDFDPYNCRKQAENFSEEIFRYKIRNLVEDVVRNF